MTNKDYLEDITAIKDMMNKSSRFISLSGLSGILAGIYALLGAAIAYYLVSNSPNGYITLESNLFTYILLDLVGIALLSTATAIVLSIRKAKKNQESLWNSTSKRLLTAFLVPLLTGGIYICIKIYNNHYGLTGALMLIFYGLALVNASKYTIGNVKYLGYLEILLGLCCALLPGYGFWFWVIGFGILHIIYGSLVYLKHDR